MSPGLNSSVRAWPCEAKTVTRDFPAITYCHSAACGCQCIPRTAPGWIVIVAPVIVVEIGNSVCETIRKLPPLNFRGSWASSEYLCVKGPVRCEPAGQSVGSGGGAFPGTI